MTPDPEPLRITFGDLKRVAEHVGVTDSTEIWVEQRSQTDPGSGLLHAVPSTGIKCDPSAAGYARLIVTVAAD